MHGLLKIVLGKYFFITYLGLGVIYFFVSALDCLENKATTSFFYTLGLLTGGDPFSLNQTFESHPYTWSLAWIIHIGSWLFIPALVGAIISSAADDLRKERDLKSSLISAAKALGIPENEIPEFIAEIEKEVIDWHNSK